MSKNDGGSAMTLDLESLRGFTPGPWFAPGLFEIHDSSPMERGKPPHQSGQSSARKSKANVAASARRKKPRSKRWQKIAVTSMTAFGPNARIEPGRCE